MDLQEVGCGNMDGVDLSQDGDRWRTLVIAVMNHNVWGISWLAEDRLASQGLCSMEYLSKQVSKFSLDVGSLRWVTGAPLDETMF